MGRLKQPIATRAHSSGAKLQRRKSKGMPKLSMMTPTASELAAMACRGEVVTEYFFDNLIVVQPIRSVRVDLTPAMLRKLDERAARLNVSRHAVIRTLLGRALNEGKKKTR
jgi:Ribbon-helix-helix protein, copG family